MQRNRLLSFDNAFPFRVFSFYINRQKMSSIPMEHAFAYSMGMCALWGSPERGGKGVYFALFLRLRVSVRITAAPVIELTHRAAHRPRLDSSAVRGEVLERLKMIL